MKQVLRKGLKDIVVDEVPDPTVIPHHVLLKPVVSLISAGTETASIHQEGLIRGVAENPSHIRKVWDAMKIAGPVRTVSEVRAKLQEYAVLGYAGAGVVVERHPTVRDIEIGQRVAYGGEGTGHAETILAGRNLVAQLPDAVTHEQACFTTLGSIALNAVRISEIGVGDVVAVIGLGLVGQLAAQLARVQGAVVIGTDLRAERTTLAGTLGADHVITGGDVEQQVAAITQGRGADCVIVAAAAQSAAPCQLALRLCRDRGRIVVVGAVEMSFPWNDMYLKEVKLFMARAYGPGSYDPSYEKQGRDYPEAYVRWTENRNMQEFLRLLAERRVNVDALVSHRFPLQEADRAYHTIMEPGSTSLAVLLQYPIAPTAKAPPSPQRHSPTRKVVLASDSNGAGLRVALVGAGNLARWAHLPNLRRSPDARLHAVCSMNGARGKNYALRFGAAYCTTEYEQILADPEIDMVLIVSRNQHHASQALAALNAGKHVFLEKPMALTEDECRALVDAVDSSGKLLTVGFNRRFAPDYVAMKRALAHRQYPVIINCRVNSPGISGSYWMADPSIGGAILGEACHFVDLFYWLLESEPTSVAAASLPLGRSDPVGENNVAATFTFADGSIANLTYCTVGTKTSGGERVEVFSPGISVVTEDFKWLETRGARRSSKRRWWPAKGYAEQLEGFLRAVKSGGKPAVDVVDGTRATLACLRLLAAVRSVTKVDIDLASLIGGSGSSAKVRAS
jgi:predicted dehydrogenase/threonine dehydrogenase-like Zn-dependent dehydrogenase